MNIHLRNFSNMRKYILYILLLIGILPATAVTQAKVVNVQSSLNIRESADVSSNIVGKVNKGEMVDIQFTNNDGWTYIRYKSTVGFVKSSYLKKIESSVTSVDRNNNNAKSVVDFSPYRWKILLIIILLIFAIAFLRERKYIIGIALMALLYLTEMWYLNQGYPNWFVRPFHVGWIWTIINGILFILFLIFQFHAINFSLSYFGVSGRVSSWGLLICFAMSVLTSGLGIAGAFILLPIIFFVNIWNNFSLHTFLTILVGCAVWYAFILMFVDVTHKFNEFFVWATAAFILGSIPSSNSMSSSSDSDEKSNSHIQVQTRGDGSKFYNDEKGLHDLSEDEHGNLHDYSRGNMFNDNGYRVH